MKTNKCIKEWNATTEALGNGLQTLMIRVYTTTKDGFLLYPTWAYNYKSGFIDGFKKEYQNFVKDNSLNSDSEMRRIKYYAKVEEIIELPLNKIRSIDKYFIWTTEHVKSYIDKRTAYVWILRVYKLENSTNVNLTQGQIYGDIKQKIDITNLKPVLDDSEFNKIKREIVSKLE